MSVRIHIFMHFCTFKYLQLEKRKKADFWQLSQFPLCFFLDKIRVGKEKGC